MRQIAVLPYRFGGPDKDGPTEILLVTSRGTGRWVVPKGNPLTGLDRHASAAVEAEEEAGVIGAVCPTAGLYQLDSTFDTDSSLADWVERWVPTVARAVLPAADR